jgi:hypothetical protein
VYNSTTWYIKQVYNSILGIPSCGQKHCANISKHLAKNKESKNLQFVNLGA